MLRRWITVCLSVLIVLAVPAGAGDEWPALSTFSIVGYDPVTGDLGVAVQSRFLAVGAVVPFAQAGVGAVATQAWANTTYGPRGLDLLRRGAVPAEAIRRLTVSDSGRARRQMGIVSAKGLSWGYTGRETSAWAGHRAGRHFCVQGNILAGPGVVDAMARAFQTTEGDLSARLVAALAAGQEAGGDTRGQQSAALLVVRQGGGYSGFNDRFIDLRVDDHPRPIEELRRVHRLWEETFGRSARLQSAERFQKQGNRRAAELERRRAGE